ncbi:hypothetical protein F0562_020600 [Nyssa sinensis]|uniref:23 kDa jasmonate-induced protein-like n=1 Tax=Nyssa sinensis TaxID=561372 RepID=A0A5J5BV53_9ASTE|nr:hypothetical protein F0562_020600 [Nyssa sinensis]
MKDAENKAVNARQFAENLKKSWGTGVSTLCLVYNATGDTVTFVTSHDWFGHIGPSPYPQEIANGQWGAFLHVKTSGVPSGSVAAVVYRGKNENGNDCDWMLSWSNPWRRTRFDNKAYSEIREADYFPSRWDDYPNLLENSGLRHNCIWNNCSSTVAIGSDTSPIFDAIMTLKDA